MEKSKLPKKLDILSERTLGTYPRVTAPDPEFASKYAWSPALGTDAPEAPPEVVDQFAVFAAVHDPDPPTQYRLATIASNKIFIFA